MLNEAHDLKEGWGVVRLEPWHLAGVFASSIDAEKLAQQLGPAYLVKFGDHEIGSSEFSFLNSAML
jgi:hypothetical protein